MLYLKFKEDRRFMVAAAFDESGIGEGLTNGETVL